MSKQNDSVEKLVDRKLGTYIEHMNDQFERILEAVQSGTQKIPKISERLETVEYDVGQVKLLVRVAVDDRKLIKARTEKHAEKLEDHEKRITLIEKAA